MRGRNTPNGSVPPVASLFFNMLSADVTRHSINFAIVYIRTYSKASPPRCVCLTSRTKIDDSGSTNSRPSNPLIYAVARSLCHYQDMSFTRISSKLELYQRRSHSCTLPHKGVKHSRVHDKHPTKGSLQASHTAAHITHRPDGYGISLRLPYKYCEFL